MSKRQHGRHSAPRLTRERQMDAGLPVCKLIYDFGQTRVIVAAPSMVEAMTMARNLLKDTGIDVVMGATEGEP